MALLDNGVGFSLLCPHLWRQISGGKSLPQFLSPPVVDVFHFQLFLQEKQGELGIRAGTRGGRGCEVCWASATSALRHVPTLTVDASPPASLLLLLPGRFQQG